MDETSCTGGPQSTLPAEATTTIRQEAAASLTGIRVTATRNDSVGGRRTCSLVLLVLHPNEQGSRRGSDRRTSFVRLDRAWQATMR